MNAKFVAYIDAIISGNNNMGKVHAKEKERINNKLYNNRITRANNKKTTNGTDRDSKHTG